MATAKAKKRKKPLEKTFDVIRIEAKRDPSEPNDVYVGLGSRNFQLQREQLIPVPSGVTSILHDAVIEKRVEGEEGGRAKMVRITRFPFTVLYTNIGSDAYKTLREIALVRSLTQADVDGALSPPTDEGPDELQT